MRRRPQAQRARMRRSRRIRHVTLFRTDIDLLAGDDTPRDRRLHGFGVGRAHGYEPTGKTNAFGGARGAAFGDRDLSPRESRANPAEALTRHSGAADRARFS